MRTATVAQCTVLGISLILTPWTASGVPQANRPAPQTAPADLWEEFLQAYLEHLLRLLECGEPTDRTPVGMIKSVTDCYHQGGIPPSADEGEGRALIRDLYAHVRDDQGALDPDTRQRFLNDLTIMYTDFGGNPGDLLDPSSGS